MTPERKTEIALASLDKALNEIFRLRQALRNLIQAADHIDSQVYDWQRLLPRFIEDGRKALKERRDDS